MKCEICGEEAGYRFSPDLDIQGLGACETHRQDMGYAYYILFQDGEKKFNEFLQYLKSKPRKTPPNSGYPPDSV